MTRARAPRPCLGDAPKPETRACRLPLLGRAQPAGHAVRGDPPQHDRERLRSHTSGGTPRAGGAFHSRSASSIRLRRSISGCQYLPPRGSVPTAHAEVHVPQGLGHLVRCVTDYGSRKIRSPGRRSPPDEGVAERAHLAPQHRVRPVLDVEVVILYIWGKTVAGQAELGVERLPVRIGGKQFPVSVTMRSRSA